MIQNEALEALLKTVLKAGSRACELKKQGLQIKHKSNDEGPVTNADLELNQILIEMIEKIFPMDAIVSEEGSPLFQNKNKTRTWFIDPIDGTSDFIKGNTEWSLMIGYAVEGRAHFGIVYQPEEESLYWGGIQLPAMKMQQENRFKIQASRHSKISEATCVQSRSHPDSKVNRLLNTLPIKNSYYCGSIGVKAAQIAEGKGDFYLNFSSRCKIWDICAPEAILGAAGGEFCFYQKNNTSHSRLYDFNENDVAILDPFHMSTKALSLELIQSVTPFLKMEYEG